MRKFLVGIITSLVFSLLLSMGPMSGMASVLDPVFLKSSLADSKIYTEVAAYGSTALDKLLPQLGDNPTLTSMFRPLIKDVKAEVNGNYLQSKVESILDQTFSYLKKDSDQLPTISFTDLSAKLKKRNPLFVSLIPSMGLSVYLDKPLTIPPEYAKYAPQVRDYYPIVLNLWLGFGALAAILLLIILLIAPHGGKIKTVGKAILVPSALGLAFTAVFSFWLQPQLIAWLQSQSLSGGVPDALKASLLYVANAVVGKIISDQGSVYLVLTVLGVALFFAPRLISLIPKKEQAVKEQSAPASTGK